jgi:transposase
MKYHNSQRRESCDSLRGVSGVFPSASRDDHWRARIRPFQRGTHKQRKGERERERRRALWEISKFFQELFDILSCYFPITVKQRGGGDETPPYPIDDLRHNLLYDIPAPILR